MNSFISCRQQECLGRGWTWTRLASSLLQVSSIVLDGDGWSLSSCRSSDYSGVNTPSLLRSCISDIKRLNYLRKTAEKRQRERERDKCRTYEAFSNKLSPSWFQELILDRLLNSLLISPLSRRASPSFLCTTNLSLRVPSSLRLSHE